MAGTGFSQNVNELIRYGIISEDTENKTIALHPLIQEVAIAETIPTVSDCHVMLNHLHLICLAHGLDVKRPVNVMECLKSINRHIILDNSAYYLLFLQDMFPYLTSIWIMIICRSWWSESNM